MGTITSGYAKTTASALLGVLVFLFWCFFYPHALSYQEQYQMFLFTNDYFTQRVALPGGLADYLGEFFVQFYYLKWAGALVLAALYVLLQWLTWKLMRQHGNRPSSWCYPLSFIPPMLLLWLMGDESVLLSYVVALLMAMTAAWASRCWERYRLSWPDLVVVLLLYAAAGSLAWMYVVLRALSAPRRCWWMPVWMALVHGASAFVLLQWPLKSVAFGLNYYRIPLHYHVLQAILPLAVVALTALVHCLPGALRRTSMAASAKIWGGVTTIVVFILAFMAIHIGYDKDKYELLRQDYLVRQECWDEIISRADHYQVENAFSCNCVNLALAKERRLADGMFDYYQSGEDALLMPMIRDLTSNIPTAEAFWHLGMVNSAYRYMHDLQESILNARKSGRFTKRMVECLIVNGKYALAAKHLALLQHTLFYRGWANEMCQLLYQDAKVDRHPLYGKKRKMRFKNDFLYSYDEIHKMLGLLFIDNAENTMALDYFMGELLLKGKPQEFMQYMSWVQQYGSYQYMPRGYQDAVRFIQSNGTDKTSAYGKYVRKMMGGN
ncbi:MAG: hypothetical protein IJK08_01555 [Prevotella sp.]|nr:hypothetical protein [Prevotella sp.]